MKELNTIYNQDCVEGLKEVEDDSIDLIVTSPPYNAGIKYDVYNDSLPWDKYLEWCKEWLTECYRVLKDDGRICINHYIAFSPKENGETMCRFPLFDFRNIMMEIGYDVRKLAIWDDRTMSDFTAFGSWMSASCPSLHTPFEGVLIGCKKYWKKTYQGETTISKEDFIEGISGIWNLGTAGKGLTMACFPEKLPKMCIELLSYKGDTVLDPFSGSGTTCYVAKNTGRKFIGFELSEDYYKVSLKRLEGVNVPVKMLKEQEESEAKKIKLW